MIKRGLLLLSLVAGLQGQATFTQGTPAVAAKASQLVIANGGPSCTITGNTFPATTVTVGTCTFGGVTIPSFTVPSTVVLPWAITIQSNVGSAAATFTLSITSVTPFTVQATVNGATPVGGSF